MLVDFLDDLNNLAFEFLLYLSWTIAGLLLVDAGLSHITAPAASRAAEWFAMIGLEVGQLGLSFGGVLAAAVMLVGFLVVINGAGFLLAVAHRVLGLVQDLLG